MFAREVFMQNLLLATSGGAIVDIIALVFIALFTIRGFVKGFAKTFVSVFGTMLSLLFAVLLCSTVAKFLESEFSFVTTVAGKLGGSLDKIFGADLMNSTLKDASENALNDAGVGGWLIAIILAFKSDTSIPMTTPLRDLIAPTFAYYIVIIISVILLFILFKIILFLIGELVKKLYAIKLIEKTDRVLGLLSGFVSGVVHLEFLIMIISFIPLSFMQNVYGHIQASTIASFIENINLFSRIMSAISINDVVNLVKTII